MRNSTPITPPISSLSRLSFWIDLHLHAALSPCNICNDCTKCLLQLSVQQIVPIIVMSLLHNWLTLSSLVIVNHVQGLTHKPSWLCHLWNFAYQAYPKPKKPRNHLDGCQNCGACGEVLGFIWAYQILIGILLRILRARNTKLLKSLTSFGNNWGRLLLI